LEYLGGMLDTTLADTAHDLPDRAVTIRFRRVASPDARETDT
jgi:hypothetical protein